MVAQQTEPEDVEAETEASAEAAAMQAVDSVIPDNKLQAEAKARAAATVGQSSAEQILQRRMTRIKQVRLFFWGCIVVQLDFGVYNAEFVFLAGVAHCFVAR
jgi:hypothetical protein